MIEWIIALATKKEANKHCNLENGKPIPWHNHDTKLRDKVPIWQHVYYYYVKHIDDRHFDLHTMNK